jgi:hypothetical protein
VGGLIECEGHTRPVIRLYLDRFSNCFGRSWRRHFSAPCRWHSSWAALISRQAPRNWALRRRAAHRLSRGAATGSSGSSCGPRQCRCIALGNSPM